MRTRTTSAVLIAASITGLSACGSTAPLEVSQTTLHEVVYQVEGTAKQIDITVHTPSGTSQQQDLGVPIENKGGGKGLKFKMSTGEFAYISAQINKNGGTATCSITVDGVVIAQNTASGAHAIVSCDGTV